MTMDPFRQLLPLTLCLLGTVGSFSAFAQDQAEQTELTAMVRQIDWMQRIAAQKASHPTDTRARYYFDYPRLSADLARIRSGISDYLTPERAQPRDPLELEGHYRQNTPAPKP